MEIKLNGEIRQIKDGMTLQELVDSLQLPNRALAVAVNRTVITRQKWPEVVLHPADQVELGTCDRRRLTYLCAERKEQQSSEELCRISETGKKEKQ